MVRVPHRSESALGIEREDRTRRPQLGGGVGEVEVQDRPGQHVELLGCCHSQVSGDLETVDERGCSPAGVGPQEVLELDRRCGVAIPLVSVRDQWEVGVRDRVGVLHRDDIEDLPPARGPDLAEQTGDFENGSRNARDIVQHADAVGGEVAEEPEPDVMIGHKIRIARTWRCHGRVPQGRLPPRVTRPVRVIVGPQPRRCERAHVPVVRPRHRDGTVGGDVDARRTHVAGDLRGLHHPVLRRRVLQLRAVVAQPQVEVGADTAVGPGDAERAIAERNGDELSSHNRARSRRGCCGSRRSVATISPGIRAIACRHAQPRGPERVRVGDQ